jgi:hypothetical protein
MAWAKLQLAGNVARRALHPSSWDLGVVARDRRWLLLAAFTLTKLLSFWGKSPLYTGDEELWGRLAGHSLFGAEFWTGNRPFTTPLLHKLAGLAHDRVIGLQALIGAAAWAVLAFAVSRLIRSKLGSELAFALILALGLTSAVLGWDVVIRSESLSNSCLVLLIAATLNLLRSLYEENARAALAWSAAAAFAGLFASFARDSNAYIVTVLVPFLAIPAALLVSKHRHAATSSRFPAGILALTALSFLLTSVVARRNAEESERYRWPLTNVVFKRVLPDRAKLAYFHDELGMPVSPTLLRLKHKQMSSGNWLVRRAPELEAYRAWLVTKGYAGYQRYLLSHPADTWKEALREVPKHAAQTHANHTRRGVNPVTRTFDALLIGTFSRFPWLTLAVTTLAGLVALGVRDHSLRLLGGMTVFATLVMITQAYICFHGDALEVARHCLNVGLFFWIGSVSGILVIGLLSARFVRGRSDRSLRPDSRGTEGRLQRKADSL